MTTALIEAPIHATPDDVIPRPDSDLHLDKPEVLAFIASTRATGLDRPRLAVLAPFDNGDLDRQKEVMPKGRFHAKKKIWSWPLTTASCRKLRQVYGDRLNVRPELKVWYQKEMAIERERDRERALQIAESARRQDEESRLGAERALFGSVAWSVSPFENGMGVPGEAPELYFPPDFIEISRTPPDECEPVTASIVRRPPAVEPHQRRRLDVQLAGAAWLAQNGGGILADEVGLGKSLTLLLAMLDDEHSLSGPHLVVAPLKVAQRTWPHELAKWVGRGALILPQWGPGASGEGWKATRARSIAQCKAAEGGSERPVVLVVNHDALVNYREWLTSVTWASVVLDEADQVLSIGHRGHGKGTKAALGVMALDVREDGLRVAMTGTPFRGRLQNMYGLVDFVHPGAVGSTRAAFAKHLTQRASEDGGGATLDRVQTGKEREWSHIMRTWVLRRTRTAAQRALIEQRVEIVKPVPAQLEQDTLWRTRTLWSGPHVENDEFEQVETPSGTIMRDRKTGALLPDVIAAVSRRIQLSVGEMVGLADPSVKPEYAGPSPKVDRIIEMLDERGLLEEEWWWMAGETGKVIIASAWTSGLDLVQRRLQERIPARDILRIDGKTSPKELEATVENFTSPRGPGVLLLSSKAGGAGLTLDQYCDRMIIMSEHWTHDVQVQAIGRISNRTAERPREIVLLRTEGMLDLYLGGRTSHQDQSSMTLLQMAQAGG